LEELVKPLSWTDRLEKLSIPVVKKTDTEDLTRSIEKQLTGNISTSERDDAVSNTMQETDVKPMTERPEVMGTIPQWIMTLRAYFKEIIEERAIHFGNIRLQLELPEKVDARLLRMIFLSIPVIISEMLRRDLDRKSLLSS